jgi:hypothetical protein
MQITPSSTLSATGTPGIAPCRASIAAQAWRRAAFTALVTRAWARGPPEAISLSVRHAVGTEATRPCRSRWSARTRKSLITSAPSAIAHARSAATRPRSWTSSRGVASARDSPVLSANRRSSTSPACDTTPPPPDVTSSPFDQPVTFTLRVLLDLAQMTTSATVIVPAQEHFLMVDAPVRHQSGMKSPG